MVWVGCRLITELWNSSHYFLRCWGKSSVTYGGDQLGEEQKPPIKCKKVTVEWPFTWFWWGGVSLRNYKTPPHPNHVKHADRRSTGGRYDTVASYYRPHSDVALASNLWL